MNVPIDSVVSDLNLLSSSMERTFQEVSRPFKTVEKSDPVKIFECLRDERPAVIILALSYFEERRKQKVLKVFKKNFIPLEYQNIIRGLSMKHYYYPEPSREVERIFERKLAGVA